MPFFGDPKLAPTGNIDNISYMFFFKTSDTTDRGGSFSCPKTLPTDGGRVRLTGAAPKCCEPYRGSA